MTEIKYLDNKTWDFLINITKYPSAFLTSWWLRLVEEVFEQKLALLRVTNKEIDCLAPVYTSQNNYFSVGLVGYGGPSYLQGNEQSTDHVIKLLQNYMKISSFSVISCPQKTHLNSNFNIQKNTTRILKLSIPEEEMFKYVFNGKIRTAIRKAQKLDVIISQANIDDIDTLHRLIISTQERVNATYRTPVKLLEKYFKSNSLARIYKATLNNKIIATCIAITSKYEMSYYLNGWDKNFSQFYPNQALVYKMIKDAQNQGINFFNFGVSHYNSLEKAKSQWGGDEYQVYKISNM